MPQFKTTYNILKKYDEDEAFDPNWMDSDKLVLPPKLDWDYSRELTVEDIDLWEMLYEGDMGVGVYVAWMPYAEFYMITTGIDNNAAVRRIKGIPYYDRTIETFYGAGAQQRVYKRATELGIKLNVTQEWVDDKDLWLYQTPTVHEPEKLIILP
jgi:hypothetical protein